MATYVKYDQFMVGLMNKLFDLFGTDDTVKASIHSDAPTTATDDELADLTVITGTGYTGVNSDIQNDATLVGSAVVMTGVDFVWTASAADWTAGRYVSIWDDTSTTDRLIANWDYGGNFTVGNGETFTLDFGASVFSIQ